MPLSAAERGRRPSATGVRPLLSGHEASPLPPVARLASSARQATGTPRILTPATAAAVLPVSIFASLLGVAFYERGIASVVPNVAGLFINLVPVLTARLVWLLLGESQRSHHLAGIAVIFMGIYLATFRWAKRMAVPGAPSRQPPGIC